MMISKNTQNLPNTQFPNPKGKKQSCSAARALYRQWNLCIKFLLLLQR